MCYSTLPLVGIQFITNAFGLRNSFSLHFVNFLKRFHYHGSTNSQVVLLCEIVLLYSCHMLSFDSLFINWTSPKWIDSVLSTVSGDCTEENCHPPPSGQFPLRKIALWKIATEIIAPDYCPADNWPSDVFPENNWSRTISSWINAPKENCLSDDLSPA